MNFNDFTNRLVNTNPHCIIGTIILISFCTYVFYFLKKLYNAFNELSDENDKIKMQISHINKRINGVKNKHKRVVKKNKPVTIHERHVFNYDELQNTFIVHDDM
ncbi:hypothetical protein PV-S19_0298 [Pacmanvirus S19]|nr:hypothetical protein PV-S19_0298 [Pacmanvirus S19]